MPELPEVAALVDDLADRLSGRAVARVDVAAFSALKTFDPPISALAGLVVEGVSRHGKFLDIDVSGLHVLIHLARGGWIRWRESVPDQPPKPGRGQVIAVRVALDDGSGLDITEAGTKKRLALYVVRDPADVPGVARLGPDPLAEDFTVEALQRILDGAGRSQIKGVLRDQSIIAASATPIRTSCCTRRGCRRSSRPPASGRTRWRPCTRPSPPCWAKPSPARAGWPSAT